MSNTEILNSLINCNDLNKLSTIYQDQDLPNHVRKRARFKIACIWKDADKEYALKVKRSNAAKKAAITRKAKKEMVQHV